MLYNSLTRKKEEFKPLNPPNVGMYTCGPTVYDYLSIGNFRTFVLSDTLRRVLEFNGYSVQSVMNITDVGHLVGDGDLGEDKITQAAKKEHKTAWDIVKFYSKRFLEDVQKLNIRMPDVMPKATEHIKEQIELIRRLEEKGFTYKTSDGVYFNTKVFEQKAGKKYGELSTLDQIKASARVPGAPEKKNPRDFALWKFSYPDGRSFNPTQDDASRQRHMEWESSWGTGFPGWHIECSAMSMKYLGESFDIHVGGEDLRQTHHPNEIAQSEAATGKKFVHYWVHGAFILVDGQRMGKSLKNIYTISDVEEKGFEPLSLRYLYLTAHYRDPLNFTWESLDAAQKALERLRTQMSNLKAQNQRSNLSNEKSQKVDAFRSKFREATNDDLNTPQALAVMWEAIKSDIPSGEKRYLILGFDEVLGLDLERVSWESRVPREVEQLVEEREKLRKEEKWKEADEIRERIEELGYKVEDTEEGPRVKALVVADFSLRPARNKLR